jgi:hypothetical protein
MSLTMKLSGLGILVIAIIVSGVLLAKSGKPYNPVLFNVHKLISLAAVVLGGIWVYNLYGSPHSGNLLITLIVVAALLYIVLFVTGGMLNVEKPFEDTLRVIHKYTPAVAVIFTVVIFYLLLKK